MKIELEKVKSGEDKYTVFLDSEAVGYTYIWNWKKEKNYRIYVDSDKLEKVFKYKISEFDETIELLELPFSFEDNHNFDWINGIGTITIRFTDYFDEIVPFAYVEVQADTDNWEKPFSLMKMVDSLENLCRKTESVAFHLEDPEIINNGFGIKQEFTDRNKNICDVYEEILETFTKLISGTISSLLDETRQNSITSVFDFPKNIQVPCEQYLVYFSKFLEDLGLNAKTTIETEAQSTLFTVTPEDPSQALSQIRDALNIYLSLPEIPDVELVSKNYSDIGVQQLISNVYHLKSQLILAHSIIQAKDSTIKNLSVINYKHKVLLESADKEKPNQEKTLNGLITISEYKGNGFKINLPELFRLIKRKFE
ncbi:hypothetical protein AB9G26_06155 [Francisella philomiragia]|uniref:hypothetical protein n=1 Tax=Francisella philomiragia TaxID=28110 RepID=UPI0035176633